MSMSNSVSVSHWNACSAGFFTVKKYAVKGRIYSKWADLNYSLVFKKNLATFGKCCKTDLFLQAFPYSLIYFNYGPWAKVQNWP